MKTVEGLTLFVLVFGAFIGAVCWLGSKAMHAFEQGQLDRSSRRVQRMHEQRRQKERDQ